MKKDKTDIIGEYAAKLSLIEVSIGSLLHGFKIPLSGQLLSLNQGAVLTFMLKSIEVGHASAAMMVSNISAVLKSLSPAGRKLGPMLSIGMQGQLYALGVKAFGYNRFGVFVGSGLLSLWAFIQPFLTYYLFFGYEFFEALKFFLVKIEKSLGIPLENQISILLGLVVLKALMAGFLGLIVYSPKGLFYLKKDSKFESIKVFQGRKQVMSFREILLLSLKDLLNPVFIFSFILMLLFFYFSRHEWSQMIWYSLRPLAIAFAFFFISRHPRFYNFINTLKDKGYFPQFFKAFDKTLGLLRRETK